MSEHLDSLIIGVGSLVASKELITKLLGPTADYLGEGTRDLVKKGSENLSRILGAACEKLKGKLDESGQVNPRVLKNVWDEGRFVEDAFLSEYFSGLLVSGRTQDGQDDSAVPLIALVKSMSSHQIRLHFIVYYLLPQLLSRYRIPEKDAFRPGIEMYIPGEELLRAMDFKGADGEAHLLLAITGLLEHRLLAPDYSFGTGGFPAGRGNLPLDQDGMVVCPNERGARLFLRVLGLRGLAPAVITSVNVDYSLSQSVKSLLVNLPKSATCRCPRPRSKAY